MAIEHVSQKDPNLTPNQAGQKACSLLIQEVRGDEQHQAAPMIMQAVRSAMHISDEYLFNRAFEFLSYLIAVCAGWSIQLEQAAKRRMLEHFGDFVHPNRMEAALNKAAGQLRPQLMQPQLMPPQQQQHQQPVPQPHPTTIRIEEVADQDTRMEEPVCEHECRHYMQQQYPQHPQHEQPMAHHPREAQPIMALDRENRPFDHYDRKFNLQAELERKKRDFLAQTARRLDERTYAELTERFKTAMDLVEDNLCIFYIRATTRTDGYFCRRRAEPGRAGL